MLYAVKARQAWDRVCLSCNVGKPHFYRKNKNKNKNKNKIEIKVIYGRKRFNFSLINKI